MERDCLASRALASLTLLVVGVAAAGAAAPAQLVGRWTRTATAADVKHADASGITAGSEWTLIIRKTGVAFAGSSVGQFNGKIVPATAGKVHINLGTPSRNTYTWRVSGKRLTFTKISDSEGDRIAVFNGVWLRSS